MSHTTKIKSTPIRSLTALERAVEQLAKDGINCELVRNTYPRMYYESQVSDLIQESSECHTVRLNNSRYDIGILKQADGTYTPVFDNHAQQISKEVGAICGCKSEDKNLDAVGRLMQYYTTFASIETMEQQGFTNYYWEQDESGNIELYMTENTY